MSKQLAFAGVEVAPPPPPPPPPPPVAQKWAIGVLNTLPVSTTSLTSKGLLVIQIAQVDAWDVLANQLIMQGFRRDPKWNYSKISRDKDRAITWWGGFAQSWDDVAARAIAEAAAKRAAEPDPEPEPVRFNGVAALDVIELDGDRVQVIGIDEGGMLVRDEHDEYDDGLDISWSAIEAVTPGVWRTRMRSPRLKNAPKPAKAKLHRQRPEPEADALAQRGVHVYTALVEGEWTSIPRKPRETGPNWIARAKSEAAQGVRVRVYDGAPRCTWDSLDGAP